MVKLSRLSAGLVLVGIATVVFSVPRVFGVADIITDQQIQTIKNSCLDLQATLNQLHQSDTVLRYNRGQLYRTISEKLMVPLNQRIASNQLDGGTLVKITADFSGEYQLFYDSYKNYEISLSSAMKIDCRRQPTTFYDQVADARKKRQALHQSSEKLTQLAVDYQTEFNTFTKTIEEPTK